MPRFRKRPVEVEAFQMTPECVGIDDQPEWLKAAWQRGAGEGGVWFGGDDPHKEELLCGTLDGMTRINWGDWIIRGVEGELYPCKPNIFEATYEEMSDLEVGYPPPYELDTPCTDANS